MKLFGSVILMTALAGAALAQDGLPSQKVLTLDVAQTIAHEALMACRANGYKVTVTVVDGANVLKALLRDDGAGMATVEVGRMKTNSVMAFGRRRVRRPTCHPELPRPPQWFPEPLTRKAECRSRWITS